MIVAAQMGMELVGSLMRGKVMAMQLPCIKEQQLRSFSGHFLPMAFVGNLALLVQLLLQHAAPRHHHMPRVAASVTKPLADGIVSDYEKRSKARAMKVPPAVCRVISWSL